MEIVRSNLDVTDIKGSNSLCFDMNDSILMLERTFHAHKATARNHNTVLFKVIRGDDDIGDTGFIFERQKDKTLRGPWALPCDDTSWNPNKFMIGTACEVICGHHSCLSKRLAMIGERMRTGGETSACIISRQAFVIGHLPERHRRGILTSRFGNAPQQWSNGAPGLLNLPEGITPVLDFAQ